MKNLFIPILIIALIVGLGCGKNLFQEKSIVGKWRMVKFYDPDKNKWEESEASDQKFYELFENGDIKYNFGKTNTATYTLDKSSEPYRLIIKYSEKESLTWIYKFQGDRLITKHPRDNKYGVAKDFSLEPNFAVTEWERK